MRVMIRDARGDEEAVASTVGTIMALLVFLTFLSLIVNQYVPVWMKDTEAAHMNGALGQFGGIKGSIDLQILAAQSALNAGQHYIPVTSANAVGLGVDGVPIFAAATTGTLSSFPNSGPFTVEFNYLIRSVSTHSHDQSNGSIELEVQNRYYVPQRVAYENGAVIRYQSDGQVVRAQPTFDVVTTNNTLDISFALVSLFGAGGVTGTSTEVVNTQVFSFDRQDYSTFPSNAVIWVNHTSRYGLAWYQFLNQTLANRLNLAGTYSQTALDVSFTAMKAGKVVYMVSASLNPATHLYGVRLEIHNNPGVISLSILRLQHALVQVQVGENSLSV